MKKTIILLIAIFTLLSSFSTIQVSAEEQLDAYTPCDLTAEQIKADDTHPYGSALLTFKINNLPRSTDTVHWEVCIEKKIGDGSWSATNGLGSEKLLDEMQKNPGIFSFEQLYIESDDWDGSKQISYRLFVKKYDETWTQVGVSKYSNIASIGLISSKWAVTELKKAEELGLIPAILNGADMTKPITREEFCELAVLLYQKVTGKEIEDILENPFTDTQNPKILNAYNLGITKGISQTTFEPQTLINREQCAAMLFRTIKAINPNGDYTISGVKDFPDQKNISNWAVEATKYMSKIGIIKGDSKGNFTPKATTTAEQAAGYGMATREAAVLMAVRSYDKLSSPDKN